MKKSIVTITLILTALACFWFFYPLRSYLVMSVYSSSHAKQSVMAHNEFDIDIQSGKGWYPFVMTYNAAGFSQFSGIEADISIMYNFGAFDFVSRTSSLFDRQSDKYSSFYGAYVVQESSGIFGFSDENEIDLDEISLAIEYDYTKLVIKDFGCALQTFSISEFIIEKNAPYAQSTGWTRIDATMTANGAAHNYLEYRTPYLQYGRPMQDVETDFEVTKLYGRVYAKYFCEFDSTIMIYVIAPNLNAVNSCDQDILEKITIVPLS